MGTCWRDFCFVLGGFGAREVAAQNARKDACGRTRNTPTTDWRRFVGRLRPVCAADVSATRLCVFSASSSPKQRRPTLTCWCGMVASRVTVCCLRRLRIDSEPLTYSRSWTVRTGDAITLLCFSHACVCIVQGNPWCAGEGCDPARSRPSPLSRPLLSNSSHGSPSWVPQS